LVGLAVLALSTEAAAAAVAAVAVAAAAVLLPWLVAATADWSLAAQAP